MVKLPWRGEPDDDATASHPERSHDEAIHTCDFQDGTVAVHEDVVVIERSKRSSFDDVTIQLADVVDVEYAKGITIGYLQIEVRGVEPDEGGWFSDPVNENTLHFGRRSRDCARQARDEILARAGGGGARAGEGGGDTSE